MASDEENNWETETCTGQCGYSPMCRQCELEKKKLMQKKLGKAFPEEMPFRDDEVS